LNFVRLGVGFGRPGRLAKADRINTLLLEKLRKEVAKKRSLKSTRRLARVAKIGSLSAGSL